MWTPILNPCRPAAPSKKTAHHKQRTASTPRMISDSAHTWPQYGRYDAGMSSPQPGAQLVHRIAAVLRAVSVAGVDGATTSEVAARAGLTRPTAHRLLSSLRQEDYLARDEDSARWLLGPDLYLLGTMAAPRFDAAARAQPVLAEIARSTGESAFLSVLRGTETVCLLSEPGSFPLRSFVLKVGSRFPLGVASAGLALLACRSREYVTEFLATARLDTTWGEPYATAPLVARLNRTRRLGYSVNPGLVVEGSWGMSAVIPSRAGDPTWAVSITGVETRFKPGRRPELGRQLTEAAANISRLLV